ncbi:gamma-glutamyltransferase [Kineosporia succinea]|uniref:Gamma-glutamyltranspeptidase/glutathione hydrolase n=1 Tax=Kineosporia succinea TaxID=84632 RepID=A0ABT9P9B3_9ACTN|nr:gamma-glutamyltransferase [Kineosporia succinea]MDP9829284.1 gamma-glutamyltranspeptidase/glutathione hydrolase [Kineosporia succinea]
MRTLLARRSVATGTLGAVAAGSRVAAGIGLSALLEGGNAFDAVVAAGLAETVALPSKCGLAGDVVAIYTRAGDSTPTSLIALGGAAAGLHDAAAARGWDVPATGGLSVGIPGAPAGYDRLGDLGRLGRPRLTAPARALASRGIVWSPLSALLAHEARDLLAEHQPGGSVFAPATGPIEPGAVVPLPGMARLLDEFAERGAQLNGGRVGEAIVRRVTAAGGCLTLEDLTTVTVDEAPAHRVDTAHGPLWATNAPTYGRALTEVFADGEASPAGPDRVREVLARQARGALALAGEGTSTVAAVDREGNAVVVVHSNSFPQFGSGLVVEDYDLVLNNRAGRGFAFEPGHPNAPVAGRRPLTTLHAWATRHTGGWVLGATPGGEQQVPWNVALLNGLLPTDRTENDLGQALVTPRWQIGPDGTARTEGTELPAFGARSSHVLVRTGTDRATAAADPRWDGAAVSA